MTIPFIALVSSIAFGAESFEGQTFYIGDPHVHTGASADGGSSDLGVCKGSCGAVADLADSARSYGLDWLSVTDHVNGRRTADAQGFARVLEILLEAHDPDGGLVVLPGAELRIDTPEGYLGHKNLYFAADNKQWAEMNINDLRYDGSSAVIADCDSLWTWMEDLEARWGDVMLLSHHPTRTNSMATAWDCHSGELAARFSPAVEIYSRHGDSMGCPAEHDDIPQGCASGSEVAVALDPEGLALKLSFIGGTDGHDTQPGSTCALDNVLTDHAYGGGLTVVVLDEQLDFDRSSLFDAIRQGSTYATSGPLLPVMVDYSSQGERLGGMGESITLPSDQGLTIELRLPAEHQSAVLGVDLVDPQGETAMTAMGDGTYRSELEPGVLPAWLYPRVEIDGLTWYDEPCEDGGQDYLEHLWISPVFLSMGAQDTGAPDTGTQDSETPGDTSTDSPPSDSEAPGDSGDDPDDSSCAAGCSQRGSTSAALFILAMLGLGAAVRRGTSRV